MNTTFEFTAKDGQKIFVRQWLPDNNEINAIIQVAHGMAEHSGRYTEFAEFFASKGFAVYVNDHRGHGQTAKDLKNVGFLAPNNGWQLVLDDVHQLTQIIKEKHPNKPIFLLGHSFGSMLARAYILEYANDINGVIISGTTGTEGFIVDAGKFLASLQGIFKGKNKPSKLLTGMSFKGYNDPFKPTKTPFDWLSRDEERNKNYWKDPYCGTIFSNRFFYDMLSLIKYINKATNYQKIPQNLPVLFISGTMDPVGEFGKGVKKVYNKFKQKGVQDINLKLYEGGRHEMLNETNRKEVYQDIFDWIGKYIKN
jgi:alpha-beta hydrolase superfamily lysophospholipase